MASAVASYYDRLAAVYGSDPAAAARRAAVIRWAEARLARGARVLDLGCGPGLLLRELVAHRPDLALQGMDISSQMVNRARRELAGTGVRVALLDDVGPLPLADRSIDTVTATRVLQVISARRLGPLLREVRRVLAPGGRLIATLPTGGGGADGPPAIVGAWAAAHGVRLPAAMWPAASGRPLAAYATAVEAAGFTVVQRSLRVDAADEAAGLLARWRVQGVNATPAQWADLARRLADRPPSRSEEPMLDARRA